MLVKILVKTCCDIVFSLPCSTEVDHLKVKDKTFSFDITLLIYNFYFQFNNNYRPIYHLERLFINLINEHQRLMQNT